MSNFDAELNPWYRRAAKFLITLGTAVVVLGNAWADGPAWLSPLAATVGAVLTYWVPNAPKYTDPRTGR